MSLVVTALLAAPLYGRLDPANISMLFLLAVLLVAVWLGRNPAILSAVCGVALFDYFFVPPRFTFAVSQAQYLVTFAVMLLVSLQARVFSKLAEPYVVWTVFILMLFAWLRIKLYTWLFPEFYK